MPSRVSIAGLWVVAVQEAVNEVDGAEATADTGHGHEDQPMRNETR